MANPCLFSFWAVQRKLSILSLGSWLPGRLAADSLFLSRASCFSDVHAFLGFEAVF